MLDLSNAGIFWVVSDDPTQQKLLRWSIQLAKRHYPELPRCVATTDSALKVDAETISFTPRQSDPKIESALQISLSPFERTIYLCCRSMILHRFEHLLQQCEFEGHCQPIADHPYLNHWIRPIHAWLSYTKKAAQEFDQWSKEVDHKWLPGQPAHVFTEWHKYKPYPVNSRVCIDAYSTKQWWTKYLKLQTRFEIDKRPLPLWFQFPVLDLEEDYDKFEKLIIQPQLPDHDPQYQPPLT